MNALGNPFVWLMRFRHRCGYGVHSPFVFRFITQVLYETTPYYAYRTLDARLPWRLRLRRRKGLHLMLRLANWLQPAVVAVPPACSWVRDYLHAGCARAVLLDHVPDDGAHLVLLTAPDDHADRVMPEGGVLVIDGLQGHGQWLRGLRATVTLDLHDLGIAIYNSKLQKQHYIVNF